MECNLLGGNGEEDVERPQDEEKQDGTGNEAARQDHTQLPFADNRDAALPFFPGLAEDEHKVLAPDAKALAIDGAPEFVNFPGLFSPPAQTQDQPVPVMQQSRM